MLKEFRVTAPAKINLGLKVLPVRQDGFHGIESIFSTVSLCDELTIKTVSLKNTCSVQCDAMKLPENNTICSTYKAFKNIVNDDLPGVEVFIKKRIASGGGLGGGSSDAASFLIALDRLCNANLTDAQMKSVAGSVGSDVFFFLDCAQKDGAAIVTGRGECVKSILKRKDLHFLLVFPGVHSSTKEAYSLVDEFYESGKNPEYPSLDKLEAIYNAPVENWSFVNTFTEVISKKYPEIEQAIFDLKKNGALYTDMSGSGSTVFGVFSSESDVQKARNALSGSWNVCSCF